MEKKGYVYILSNKNNTTIYTRVTSNLPKRIYEHKNHLIDGFTKKYNLDKLLYCEVHKTILSAIQREKQIKAGSRKKKIDLINSLNPDWKDLTKDFLE